ncbi:DNA polymerase delta subunit 3 [Modicella reniformis]|uniref:DNA polymerase delta subunit 3 n=1 Tax=Modicella reniformis TaxID=1440133 RepID=A0A9P6MIB2_9FUNG|nr:DNA polymerase delta subunit 3 [Modicella reniformis]
MPLDIDNQTMELLAATVEDEKKSITYRWLSRSMGYSVNTAKQLMETYLSTLGKGKVHGTYYVARQDPQTGSQIISLVSQDDLQKSMKDSTVIGYHIYSLEPSPLKDLSVLSVANAEASQLQKDKDINIYRVIHNKEVTISKSNIKLPASAASVGSTVSSATKVPITKQSITAATSAPASTSTSSMDSKAKPASKSSVMSFFGKAATAPSKTTSSASTSNTLSKPSTTNAKTTQQKRKAASMMSSSNTLKNNNNGTRNPSRDEGSGSDDEEVDSEEERDRRLALSSRLDQDQGEVVKASKGSAVNNDALRKRPRSARLLAVDDDDEVEEEEEAPHVASGNGIARGNGDRDDDDDESLESMTKAAFMALSKEKEAQRVALENMMLMDDATNITVQGEDSAMVDVESMEDPPTTTTSAAQTGTGTGRRRGHRTVTKRKTYRNDRGYMVTEDYVEIESFSEGDTPAPKAVTHPVKVKTEVGSSSSSGGGSKKKVGSGNQSLLNYFNKK